MPIKSTFTTNDGSVLYNNSNSIVSSSPIKISGSKKIKKVVSTLHNTAVLDEDNKLYIWGANTFVLGDSANSSFEGGPLGVKSGFTLDELDSGYNPFSNEWADIDLGQANYSINEQTAVGVKTDGTLWTWGNSYVLGHLANIPVSWKQIVVANSYTLAIDSTGKMWGFGDQLYGELGVGTTTTVSTPIIAANSISESWAKVAAWDNHVIALTETGKIYSWGYNVSGQLGHINRINRSLPVQIGSANNWLDIAAGNNTSYGIREGTVANQGNIYAWGQNLDGELGINNRFYRSSPTLVMGTSSSRFSKIGAGDRVFFGLWAATGELYGAGRADNYLLPGQTVNRSSPVVIVSNTTPIVDFSIGTHNALAITANGSLYSWGSSGHNDTNRYEQKGMLGFEDDMVSLTVVAGGTPGTNRFVRVALDDQGHLWAWGNNLYGMLGTGDRVQKLYPEQVDSESWTKVVAQDRGTTGNAFLGLRDNGDLYWWGYGYPNHLLSGTLLSRSSPVFLSSGWSDVAAISNSAVGIKDGELYAWGNNFWLNDYTNYAVYSHAGFSFSTTGQDVAMFVYTTGEVETVGYGGALGINLGTLNHRSSPVVVSGSTAYLVKPTKQTIHTTGVQQYYTTYLRDTPSNVNNIVYGMGSGFNGNMFDNSTVARSSPVVVYTGNNITRVGGTYTNFFVIDDGKLYGKGEGTHGHLGDGDTISRSSPVQIGSDNWIDVSSITNYRYAGNNHLSYLTSDYFSTTFAIKEDGTLWGWGADETGILCKTQERPFDEIYTNQRNFAAATYPYYLMKQSNTGYLYGWGLNTYGRLGDNETVNKSAPVLISNTSWNSVSASDFNAFGIKGDGTLWAWGSDTGYAGFAAGDTRSSPVQIGTSSWSQVSAGYNAIAAIRDDGALFTWGENTYGQLGQYTNKSFKVISSGSAPNLTTDLTTLAVIDENDHLFTWGGYNTVGNLGLGDTISRSSPVQVGTDTWTDVDINTRNGIAVKSDGTLWTWGSYVGGVLGLNDSELISRSSPVQVGSDTDWAKVTIGDEYALAIKTDGTLWAWGYNGFGNLGIDDTINRSSPVQVPGSWTSVTASVYNNSTAGTTAAIDSNGLLYLWGRNNNGELGINTTTNRSSPVQTSAGGSWTKVSIGRSHVAAIDTSGQLFTWGANHDGELGQNLVFSTKRSNPVQLGVETDFTDVVAGANTTYYTRANTTIYATGDNINYNLNIGTTANRSSPVQVASSSNTLILSKRADDGLVYQDVGAKTKRATGSVWPYLSITTDSTLDPVITERGAIVLQDTASVSSPVQIGTDSWTMISVGSDVTNSFMIGIKTDGTIWTWGDNYFGKLGVNDTLARSEPVQVGSANNWSKVVAGSLHALALASNNDVYGWGSSNNGQLTLSALTSSNRSSPVLVATGKTDIETGALNSYFKDSSNTLTALGYNAYSQIANSATTNFNTEQTIANNVKFIGKGNLYQSSFIDTGHTPQVQGYNATGSNIFIGNILQASNTVANEIGAPVAPYFVEDYTNRSSPVQIGTANNWTKVRVNAGTDAIGGHEADFFAVALNSNNQLYAWGKNKYGQLGLNDTINRSAPTLVTANVSDVETFGGGTIYLDDTNRVYTVGYNARGVLGQNNTTNRSSPVLVSASNNDNQKTIFGSHSGAALAFNFTSNSEISANTNRLYVWGYGNYAQGGGGLRVSATYTDFRSNPVLISSEYIYSRSSPVKISSSNNWSKAYATTCTGTTLTFHFIKDDGSLWGIGDNGFGQLGDGTRTDRLYPVKIGEESWTTLGTGLAGTLGTVTTYGIRDNGELYSWGYNLYGQLGINTTTNRSSPVLVGSAGGSWGNTANVISVAPGYRAAAFAVANGHVFEVGQIRGYNSTGSSTTYSLANSNRSNPVLLATGLTTANLVSLPRLDTSNTFNNYYVTTSSPHSTYTWGNLVDDRDYTINRSYPVKIENVRNRSNPSLIDSGSWIQVAAGPASSKAINSENKLYVWGSRLNDQIPSGNDSILTPTLFTTQSVNIVGTASVIEALPIANTTNAIYTIVGNDPYYSEFYLSGSAYTQSNTTSYVNWDLDDNDFNNQGQTRSPIQVGSANNWVAAKTDGTTFAALNSNNELYTWGFVAASSNGSIGVGSRYDASSYFVRVPTKVLDNVVSFDLGVEQGAATHANGALSVTGRLATVYFGTSGNTYNVVNTGGDKAAQVVVGKHVADDDRDNELTMLYTTQDGTLKATGKFSHESVNYSSPTLIGGSTDKYKAPFIGGHLAGAVKVRKG